MLVSDLPPLNLYNSIGLLPATIPQNRDWQIASAGGEEAMRGDAEHLLEPQAASQWC